MSCRQGDHFSGGLQASWIVFREGNRGICLWKKSVLCSLSTPNLERLQTGESVFLVCVTPSGDGEPARELVLNGVTGGGGRPGVEGLFIHLKSPSAEPQALGGAETSVLSPLSPIRLPPVLCSPPHAPAASIPLLPGLLLYLPLLPWFLLSPRCGWNGLELHLGLFSFSKTESDPVSPLLKVLNGLQGPAWSGASCPPLALLQPDQPSSCSPNTPITLASFTSHNTFKIHPIVGMNQ